MSGHRASFTLFPAVDVSDGRAVRPVRGEVSTDTTHGPPLDVALAWQGDGAHWIHLVDLDAALGHGSNAELLANVIEELKIDVQLSGGIGDDESLDRALSSGCTRAIIATAALEDPAWCERAIATHGERVAVSLDVRVAVGSDGCVRHQLAPRGSTREGGDLWEALDWLDRAGCARYIVTDVNRDGMLDGPNGELYRAVAAATPTPVIASGGVSSIPDLELLARAAPTGAHLEGAIVGKALYAGRFTLADALRAVPGIDSSSVIRSDTS